MIMVKMHFPIKSIFAFYPGETALRTQHVPTGAIHFSSSEGSL